MSKELAGTVVGTISLSKQDGAYVDWWQCSRHELSGTIKFSEKVFRMRGGQIVVSTARSTDEIWDKADADEWILSRVRSRLSSGFTVFNPQTEGNIGPISALLVPTALQT